MAETTDILRRVFDSLGEEKIRKVLDEIRKEETTKVAARPPDRREKPTA